MVTLLACFLLGVISSYFIIKLKGTLFIKIFTVFLFVLMFSLMGFSIALLIGVPDSSRKWELTDETQLVNFTLEDGLSQEFYVDSGPLDTSFLYLYFYKNDNGYRIGNIRNNADVRIFEEDRTDGVLMEFTNSCLKRISLWGICVFQEKQYEFHIPPGSHLIEYSD